MFGRFVKIVLEGDFMNTKYCLLYEDKAYLKFIDDKPIIYDDISQIDLETINYSKEEYLKIHPQLKDKMIVIAKVTLNKEKDYYNVNFYNPLFQTENKFGENKLIKIKKIILDRIAKVTKKARKKLLDNDDNFKIVINDLCLNIISFDEFKFFITENCQDVNLKVREELLKINKVTDNFHFYNICSYLTSYMEFRKLLLEYFNYYRRDLVNNFMESENYLFPSILFDYQMPFYLSPYDASQDMNKELDMKATEEEEYRFSKLLDIKKRPFDDEEIGFVFKNLGIAGVMGKFDADRIYTSTKEDLLRLGIISIEDYLKSNKELKH